MKITCQSTRKHGSALITSAVMMVIVGAVLASSLLVTQNEYLLVDRSQTWNSSMALTEAGVEEALAFMNKYQGDFFMVTNWSTAQSAAEDHWSMNGNTFTMHRVLNGNGDYYDVSIDNSNPGSPLVTAAGAVQTSVVASRTPGPMFAAIGMPGDGAAPAGRRVEVRTVYSALFPAAIAAVTNIDMNGNSVRVDSFDSTLTNASFWNTNRGYGTYSFWKARANGHVVTDSSLVNAISVGQANIYGRVNVGPGGSVSVGNNGYVGPLPQIGSGIQNGYFSDDMNVIFPNVILPAGASSWPSVQSNTISTSGSYWMMGISSSLTINASNVVLYVEGDIRLSGQSAIVLTTNVTRAIIYVAGPAVEFTGNAAINNLTQRAGALGIYGLPSLTTLKLTGNAEYTGTVYAPQADFQFGGGGNDTYDFVGAVVVYSAKLNGKANFHYDESLKRNGPGIGYIPYTWTEVTGN